MSLFADIAWGRTDDLNQSQLNKRAKIIADAIESLRAFAPSWQAEVDALRDVGLERINAALLPAYEQLLEIVNLGALLSATSTSSVEIGTGAKAFVVAEAQRLNFAPTPYIVAYANSDFGLAVIGSLVSYDSETGQLVINCDDPRGTGTYNSWKIGPIATTSDLEALRDAVQTNATQVALQAATVDDKYAEIVTVAGRYHGPLATAPAEADLGDMYLDISVTPNVVKVLSETGWNPTVTVSIGGSRLQVYPAAAGGETGPFVVDGGFTTGSVNLNGVELFDDNGVTLDTENGEFTFAAALEAGDFFVFRGYLANDATDIYTKSETNSLLSAKADATAVYTKTEANGLLAAKADSASVYTKTEADGLLAAKVPTSRTLTAGTGLTGGGTLGADRTLSIETGHNEIGTYALLRHAQTPSTLNFGDFRAGSNLQPANAAGVNSPGTLGGTWKCMGQIGNTNVADGPTRTTLFLRVA